MVWFGMALHTRQGLVAVNGIQIMHRLFVGIDEPASAQGHHETHRAKFLFNFSLLAILFPDL